MAVPVFRPTFDWPAMLQQFLKAIHVLTLVSPDSSDESSVQTSTMATLPTNNAHPQ